MLDRFFLGMSECNTVWYLNLGVFREHFLQSLTEILTIWQTLSLWDSCVLGGGGGC